MICIDEKGEWLERLEIMMVFNVRLKGDWVIQGSNMYESDEIQNGFRKGRVNQ